MKKLFAYAALLAAALLLAGCAWLNEPVIEAPTPVPTPTTGVVIKTPGAVSHTPSPAAVTPPPAAAFSSSPTAKPSKSAAPKASPTPAATPVYRMISAADAKALLDKKDAVLLDVRSKTEYDAEHIKGAVLLPADLISEDAKELPQSKDTAVIIYCATGHRSAIAAETLAGYGYTRVYDLGSIKNWPYGTVSS